MGESADGYACNALILAFGDDIIAKFRSRMLDAAFGDKVRFYVMADDNACVRLYAAIDMRPADDDEEHFRVEGSPDFYGPSDSIVEEIMQAFPGLGSEEVERRLAAGAEKDIEDRAPEEA